VKFLRVSRLTILDKLYIPRLELIAGIEVVYKFEDPGFKYSHHRTLSVPGHSHINTPDLPAVSTRQLEFGAEDLKLTSSGYCCKKSSLYT
jgi:hypothetical protein